MSEIVKPPTCTRCDHPCETIYIVDRRRVVRAPWGSNPQLTAEVANDRIRWLCADCVDEIAQEVRG